MFFHCRDSEDIFIEIIEKNREKFKNGVVHSYTGTNLNNL